MKKTWSDQSMNTTHPPSQSLLLVQAAHATSMAQSPYRTIGLQGGSAAQSTKAQVITSHGLGQGLVMRAGMRPRDGAGDKDRFTTTRPGGSTARGRCGREKERRGKFFDGTYLSIGAAFWVPLGYMEAWCNYIRSTRQAQCIHRHGSGHSRHPSAGTSCRMRRQRADE